MELSKTFFSFLAGLSKGQTALLAFIFVLILVMFFFFGKVIGSLSEKAKTQKLIKAERNDAVKRSRAVLGGQITEQLSPLLKDFPARLDEVSFLGKPVDFIAFRGLEDENRNSNNDRTETEKCRCDEVLFIEVKTGNSQLSAREKAVKEAIDSGRVRYTVWRQE